MDANPVADPGRPSLCYVISVSPREIESSNDGHVIRDLGADLLYKALNLTSLGILLEEFVKAFPSDGVDLFAYHLGDRCDGDGSEIQSGCEVVLALIHQMAEIARVVHVPESHSPLVFESDEFPPVIGRWWRIPISEHYHVRVDALSSCQEPLREMLARELALISSSTSLRFQMKTDQLEIKGFASRE